MLDIRGDKEIIAICEGCGHRKGMNTNDLSKIGKQLTRKGWGWLRGDEAYDHYCSEECKQIMLTKLTEASKR